MKNFFMESNDNQFLVSNLNQFLVSNLNQFLVSNDNQFLVSNENQFLVSNDNQFFLLLANTKSALGKLNNSFWQKIDSILANDRNCLEQMPWGQTCIQQRHMYQSDVNML